MPAGAKQVAFVCMERNEMVFKLQKFVGQKLLPRLIYLIF